MDLRKLKTLVDLVSESNISELEITEAEGKVRIVKTPPTPAQTAVHYVAAPAAAPIPVPMEAGATTPAPTAAPSGKLIKSPMVGTFYRASAPGAKPFVDVGDPVKQGQAVCIVEAMKILNEIESDIDGIVKEILVENGQAVEYGQPLFVLD